VQISGDDASGGAEYGIKWTPRKNQGAVVPADRDDKEELARPAGNPPTPKPDDLVPNCNKMIAKEYASLITSWKNIPDGIKRFFEESNLCLRPRIPRILSPR